jgi:hypothetical protein
MLEILAVKVIVKILNLTGVHRIRKGVVFIFGWKLFVLHSVLFYGLIVKATDREGLPPGSVAGLAYLVPKPEPLQG